AGCGGRGSRALRPRPRRRYVAWPPPRFTAGCRAGKVGAMAVTMRQSARMGWYLMRQRLAKREKFPLLVELEPLYQCNLACAGCGKIQHPEHVLRRRMSVEQAVGAIEESGTPMVSIAGGEPLIHPEIHLIAAELVARKRIVYLCSDALLLATKH